MSDVKALIRQDLLPAILRTSRELPQLASGLIGPIEKALFKNYYQGASLEYAKYPAAFVKADQREIKDRLARARVLSAPIGLEAKEYEWLEVCDLGGASMGRVQRWAAHQLGIRHMTSNVILITPDGQTVLQKRAEDKIPFPSKWTISAGGHVSYKDKNTPLEDPLNGVARELREELGIDVADTKRFKYLGALPNHIKTWEYRGNDATTSFVQFDQDAKYIGIEEKVALLTDKTKEQVVRQIRGLPSVDKDPFGELKMTTWNVELCYFYMLKITENEMSGINFTDNEVAGMNKVSVEKMIRAGRDPDKATDSLFILFYAREDIADQLRTFAAG